MDPPPFFSMTGASARGQKRPVEIDCQIAIDRFKWDVERGAEIEHAGVVDQEAQIGDAIGQRSDLPAIRNVERERDHALGLAARPTSLRPWRCFRRSW